jgi:CheY-like chemotaxis protein
MMEKKILVIDDDKAIRNSFVLTFEDTDCKIETAESGLQGVEKIKNNHFDLVFLDLKMPQIDGVQTLRRIREFNKSLLVYIFTAFHRDFFIELEEAVSDGLQFEIVQKPLDSEQLKELVFSILTV